MTRRLLIVSPHFSPVSAPDLQRVRMSLPYYRACGWEPVVLCVDAAWQSGIREPELEHTVPGDVKIFRCRAFSQRWTRFVGVGNLGLRCWWHLFHAGSRLIRRERIDLVFFSTTQFATFPLGRFWRALHGVPYVFDMQDPWQTDHYSRAGSRKPPGGWKYPFARAFAWLLEGWSFRRVSGVMSVSPTYIDDLRRRYRWLASVPSAVIRFGASRHDLAQALQLPPPQLCFSRKHGEVHFLYTGAVVAGMPPALRLLFGALRLFRETDPNGARRLRFHFVGTSYVSAGQGRNVVIPLAEPYGVADQIDEIPHRLGHLECLRLQQEADVLLLPGSSDSAYSPSKIYPYFLADRPILGLVFTDSVLAKALRELQCAYLVSFRENELEAQVGLVRFFELALAGFPPGTLPIPDHAFFAANYLAETLTRAQCSLFDSALAFGSPPVACDSL